MYVKATRNKVGQVYFHLVESFWKDGRSRQRVLLSLGRAEDGKIDNLLEALAKFSDKLEFINLAKDIDISQTYILGPLLLLEKIFHSTGVEKILKIISEKHPKLGFDLQKVIFSLVAGRWIRPTSKRGTHQEILGRLYPEMFERKIALQHLYRALDILAQEKDIIEKKLFEYGQDLFNSSVDLVFYDLTTLRFESTRTDTGELRRFGYSKEMRSDCTQVILGLLIDQAGRPLGFEVFPGNTFEGNTLPLLVKKMRQKFPIRRVVFVADRGLFSQANLDALRGEDFKFITGMKMARGHYDDSMLDLSKYQPVKPGLKVFEGEPTKTGDRVIHMWSEKRSERDKKTRADILAKIEKKLTPRATAKNFVTHPVYRQFVKGLDEGKAELDEQAILDAEKRDGFFAMITNAKDLDAVEVVKNYRELWRIEDAFGEIKGTLKARPIFHWRDQRIIGHLVACFLAYFCEWRLATGLKGIESPYSAPRVMRDLTEVRVIPVKIKTKTVWVRTDITGPANDGLRAVGLKAPAKIIKL